MVFFCFAIPCWAAPATLQRQATDPFEPPVFASSNHVLDLIVIARPQKIDLGSFHPTAWVFEICRVADAHGDECPVNARTAAPYGGVRLQLSPGDHLRMRLINRLPPVPRDSENAYGQDPMMNAMLPANPVNLHTHGLVVEPRKADASDPTFGDYVFVLAYPAGKLPAMNHGDEIITDKPLQYDIYIPKNHPSGLFWFHPHVHGLGINQLSEGLSGVLTIGSTQDILNSASTPAFAGTVPCPQRSAGALQRGSARSAGSALLRN